MIINAVDGTTGGEDLAVSTDSSGDVSATYTSDPVLIGGSGGGTPTGCNDPGYNLSDGPTFGNKIKQYNQYQWYLNINSSPTDLGHANVTDDIRSAVQHITHADNNCGLMDDISATSNWQGTTPRNPDINSTGNCTPTSDGVNVVGFGPINSSTILAETCVRSTNHIGVDFITEADVLLNNNMPWYDTGTSCSHEYNVEGTMTHESGHIFGLAHVGETSHPNLTMSANINGTCQNSEASLGWGDVLGLRALY
jgi:hypothetical protein